MFLSNSICRSHDTCCDIRTLLCPSEGLFSNKCNCRLLPLEIRSLNFVRCFPLLSFQDAGNRPKKRQREPRYNYLGNRHCKIGTNQFVRCAYIHVVVENCKRLGNYWLRLWNIFKQFQIWLICILLNSDSIKCWGVYVFALSFRRIVPVILRPCMSKRLLQLGGEARNIQAVSNTKIETIKSFNSRTLVIVHEIKIL